MENGLSVKKNILYNTIGSFFYLGCQWLTTILIVQLGNFEMAGNLSLAISITNTFTAVANYGMRNYQVSDVNNKYSAGSYVTLRYLTCLAALILCVVFVIANGHYSLNQQLVIGIYMIFRTSEAVSDVFQGIQQKAYRMDYIGISFVVRGIISVVLFSIGLMITHNLVIAIAAMAIGTYVVIFIYDFRICKGLEKLPFSIDGTIFKALIECTPLMITLVLTTACVLIPRYYLEKMYGSEVLGYYASVATPAVIVQSLCIVVYTPLTAMIAESYEKKKKNDYRNVVTKSIAAMLAFSAVAIAGSWLLGEWGLKILFGDKILEYVYLFVPAIITTILMAFIYFFNMILTISRRLKGIMIINALSVLCIFLLSPELVRRYNMSGVNYALIIGLTFGIVLLIGLWIFDCIKYFKKERNA